MATIHAHAYLCSQLGHLRGATPYTSVACSSATDVCSSILHCVQLSPSRSVVACVGWGTCFKLEHDGNGLSILVNLLMTACYLLRKLSYYIEAPAFMLLHVHQLSGYDKILVHNSNNTI